MKPDREKVIEGLEEVIAEAVYPDRPRKFMMSLELAEDALTLLKAQEPRVMTLEEVRKLPGGALVWQEHRGVNQPRPRVVHCVTDEFIIYTDGGKWYFELDDYGTKFRLWTTEPSEMKRQAVKWE